MFVAGLTDTLTCDFGAPLWARPGSVLDRRANVIARTSGIGREKRYLFEKTWFYPGLAAVEETATSHLKGETPTFLGGI
jgi:hypothetical protein